VHIRADIDRLCDKLLLFISVTVCALVLVSLKIVSSVTSVSVCYCKVCLDQRSCNDVYVLTAVDLLSEPVSAGEAVPRPQDVVLRRRTFSLLRHDRGRQSGMSHGRVFLKGILSHMFMPCWSCFDASFFIDPVSMYCMLISR